MQVVGRKLLEDFANKHCNIRSALRTLVHQTKIAVWQKPSDIRARYPSADFLVNDQVIINIKGNTYRVLFVVNYTKGIVFFKKVGTHTEYEKWNLS